MTWYHGTSQVFWQEIQAEGVLWGRKNQKGMSRCTWLATKPKYSERWGDIILEIEYDPVRRHDRKGPLNNYDPDSWQIIVYEPIELSAIKLFAVYGERWTLMNYQF